MASKSAKKTKEKKIHDDEFFIGGWDPYVVEIAKTIRKNRPQTTERRVTDRRRS
ncbi:MAG: hypothetical protein AAF438_10960 [Pseudomonadota bacterium]